MMSEKYRKVGGKMIQEFKKFILRGNVIDLAVGVIIGGAFSKIVTSLVSDVVMPIISIITGKIDFSNMFIAFDGGKYTTLAEAQQAGASTLNYGAFITNVIDFLIMAMVIFLLIKAIGVLSKKRIEQEKLEAEKEKERLAASIKTCPYCFTDIKAEATRCPHCTSELEKS